MSRISIDVTPEEHQKLKALAALKGRSIKDYVLERTLGAEGDDSQNAAMAELVSLLDARIHQADIQGVSKRSVGEIFKQAYSEAKAAKSG